MFQYIAFLDYVMMVFSLCCICHWNVYLWVCFFWTISWDSRGKKERIMCNLNITFQWNVTLKCHFQKIISFMKSKILLHLERKTNADWLQISQENQILRYLKCCKVRFFSPHWWLATVCFLGRTIISWAYQARTPQSLCTYHLSN